MKLTDVVSKIRGKPGTIVRLEVKTAGGTERQIYDITRARIELKDSEARSEILERGPHGEDRRAPTKPPTSWPASRRGRRRRSRPATSSSSSRPTAPCSASA